MARGVIGILLFHSPTVCIDVCSKNIPCNKGPSACWLVHHLCPCKAAGIDLDSRQNQVCHPIISWYYPPYYYVFLV